ncbi:hypothetical protein [Halobacillus sp. BAB-2008]|nr:hypothetical protein [Halobacillus sp. BAB-2008]
MMENVGVGLERSGSGEWEAFRGAAGEPPHRVALPGFHLFR